MCATHGMVMEQPTLSRFNSQSTDRSFIDSCSGIVSPILSPIDGNTGQISILQTPDSKQWIDLDYLSPKILKELRRQYDPSIKDEHAGALAKSAAKVKAWVRQSKLGVDIRLRRKINAEHDEVTDIHLIPEYLDVPGPQFHQRDEKQSLIAELPGAQNQITSELPGEITELPDSSVTSELEAVSSPTRTSTDSSLGEPLPRYEPRREPSSTVNGFSGSTARSESPGRLRERTHHRSSSSGSIISTPTGGISFQDAIGNTAHGRPLILQAEEKTVQSLDDASEPIVESSINSRTSERNESGPSLADGSEVSQRLHALIAALQQSRSSLQDSDTSSKSSFNTQSPEDILNHLKIASRATYETETDAEPKSPGRRVVRPMRKKSLGTPKRKKTTATAKSSISTGSGPESGSEEDREAESASLFRKQTLPKRAPATAGAEAIWASLIRMQAKILGPEHPLTYQAKSDLARSRANGHAKGSQDLSSLRDSKQLAISTLGIVHPWVAAFTEDLGILERQTGSLLNNKPRKRSESPKSDRALVNNDFTSKLQDNACDHERSENLAEPEHGASTDAFDTVSESSAKTKATVPRIVTDLVQSEQEVFSNDSTSHTPQFDRLWNVSTPPYQLSSTGLMLPRLVFGALMQVALNSLEWLQRNYGPEKPVQPGKVRVRWMCSCGEKMHDDFVEQRPGAARALEAYLNRPKAMTGGAGTPISPGSSNGSRSFASSCLGAPPSSQTSWSSYSFSGSRSLGSNGDTKPPQTLTGVSSYLPYSPLPEPPWLLTCANEDRYTPKLAHLDMAPHKIRSDKDLALSLREHYTHVNKKWWRYLRLRGLITIEFAQFEVHQNRFTDIRKNPSLPPIGTSDYEFEPADLLPPVGSQYLLHLFKHPEDYDGELITYLRTPKKHGRLQLGYGWGIHLVEGFLADRVWMVLSAFFAIGSTAFAIAWGCTRHDVQGASGIAAWMVSLMVLLFGWLQAFLG